MEKWDLLDNKRRITGKYINRGDELPKGYYHQLIHVCIFNKEKKMLIQKRHPKKNKRPSLWDISCGGAVLAGEDTHTAASRELFEELSIDHDFSKEKILMTLTYEQGFDDYFSLYLPSLDIKNLKLQKDELTEVSFASLDEILALIEKGEFVPYRKELISLIFVLRNSKSYIST
ncbi:MAG: NUDIX domain-containing protein [Peptoniphilaceae bacterium]|nr:NUDIX domain-containing protein [Peptoniphilaceae bacterium]MDY6018131.1 NUDIX domain-containing protein [Anaerococcus sp.]